MNVDATLTNSAEPLDGSKRSEAVQRDLKNLRTTVGQVVGVTFYGTLMKMMRDSSLQGPYGHGGRGEQVFSAQLHGLLAERMGEATRGGLADGIFASLKHQQERISAQRTSLGEEGILS